MGNDEQAAYNYAKEHVELKAYLVKKFAEKRAQPDEGIISDLVHATYTDPDGLQRPLTENELLSMIEQLLVGGNETTNNALASAMLLLLQHPDQMQLLESDVDKYIKVFVEESLRYESPTQGLYRYTVQDTTLGETFIPKGSMVHLRFGNSTPAPAPQRRRSFLQKPTVLPIRKPKNGLPAGYSTTKRATCSPISRSHICK